MQARIKWIFSVYWCQLNFAMFCATSALGISLQHLNHPNFLECMFLNACVFSCINNTASFAFSLPHADGFSNICDDYGVNADEIRLNGWLVLYTNIWCFCEGIKFTKRSPPDKLLKCIITQSKIFTRKGIEKVSKSVRAYIYLVFTSQVQIRSSIVGNSVSAVDA